MADGNPDTGRALLGPERDPGRRWSEHILPFETLDQSYLEQFRNVGESHPRRKKIKSKLRELKKIGFHLRTILGRNICFQINRLGRNIKIQTKEERKRKKKATGENKQTWLHDCIYPDWAASGLLLHPQAAQNRQAQHADFVTGCKWASSRT